MVWTVAELRNYGNFMKFQWSGPARRAAPQHLRLGVAAIVRAVAIPLISPLSSLMDSSVWHVQAGHHLLVPKLDPRSLAYLMYCS